MELCLQVCHSLAKRRFFLLSFFFLRKNGSETETNKNFIRDIFLFFFKKQFDGWDFGLQGNGVGGLIFPYIINLLLIKCDVELTLRYLVSQTFFLIETPDQMISKPFRIKKP